ncbi:hypothetical protein [Roseateles sp.]|uniref:hypothetical protein n=1 Tax=Roseateles sp. TaxID=1971397 RepID=UPI0039EBAC46
MLVDELKRLLDTSFKANVQLIVGAGGAFKEAAQAARDPLRASKPDARALLGDLAKLQFEYVKELSRGSTEYWGAVAAMAKGEGTPEDASKPTSTAHAQALRGEPGETVGFQFRIDNPNAEAVNARIESQPWSSRGGETVDADSLVFRPADTVVAPGSHVVVLGQVTLDERFVPGQTYDTVIRVAGFPGHQVAFSLSVAK